MAQLSKVLKVVCWAGSVPFHQRPSRGRLFVYCCGRCSCVHLRGEPVSSCVHLRGEPVSSCVHLRGEPVSSYSSMACCSVVSY